MKILKHIGLKMGTVKLVSHKRHWHKAFEKEKKTIQKLLGKAAIEIRHVGSTSIPQMPAKPIMDISIRVKSLKYARKCANRLKALNYEHRKKGDRPGQIFLAKDRKPNFRFIHLTLVYTKNAWEDHVFFRDYLCNSRQAASKYAKLKKKLAKQFPNNRKAYTHGKTRFIRRIVKLARKQR